MTRNLHCLVYVTSRCNNECFFCYENNRNCEEMPIAGRLVILRRMMDDLRLNGIVPTIALTGGEPTLMPAALRRFLEVIVGCEVGFVNLNTNGHRLSECIDFMNATRCVDAVNISKHSVEDEGGFLPWAQIKSCVNRLGSEVQVSLNCVLQRAKVGTAQTVRRYIKAARRAGVSRIVFFQMYKDSRKSDFYKKQIVDYRDIAKDLGLTGIFMRGWQCNCLSTRSDPLKIVFKSGNIDRLFTQEEMERRQSIPVARQLILTPTGKVNLRFSDPW